MLLLLQLQLFIRSLIDIRLSSVLDASSTVKVATQDLTQFVDWKT